MTRAAILAFALSAMTLQANGAERPWPAWITDPSLKQLRALGVDTERDVTVRGAYHWRWVSRKALVVGGYRCPAGNSIDVSRTITVIGAPSPAACRNGKGAETPFLKFNPDGSAEPL